MRRVEEITQRCTMLNLIKCIGMSMKKMPVQQDAQVLAQKLREIRAAISECTVKME
jgi:hypothetical protein